MLKFKKAMTVCVDKKYNIDVQHVIDHDMHTIGEHYVYLNDDKVYIGFETKSTIAEVAKTLKEKLYKVDLTIVGGTVFVKFI